MPSHTTTIHLQYDPPLDWPFFLKYLGGRATPSVEKVEQDRYLRTFEANGTRGLLAISQHPSADCLVVDIKLDGARAGAPLREFVIGRVRQMFDLDADLEEVHRTLGQDPHMRALIASAPGVRIPGAWCDFELLMRTIAGQQVTVKAATTILGRLALRLGTQLENFGEPALLFPSPRAVADGDLSAIGMPAKRVLALQSVARSIADGSIVFPIDAKNAAEIGPALLKHPGIGPWTVSYFTLRAMRDPDAWPGLDLVLKRSVERLATAARCSPIDLPSAWKPYRGYAAMHLWRSASQQPAPTTPPPEKS